MIDNMHIYYIIMHNCLASVLSAILWDGANGYLMTE